MQVWLQRGGCETEPEVDDCERGADLWLAGGFVLSRGQSRPGEVGRRFTRAAETTLEDTGAAA